MNILNEIAKRTKLRIEEKKKRVPLDEIIQKVEKMAMSDAPCLESNNGSEAFSFEKALLREGVSFICEVKKASPSKGVIAEDFPYIQIANEYVRAGASAISVLTEPYYFLGRDSYLTEIARDVTVPLLRKDFTVDEYMIYEAKLMGASAVLLICAILENDELERYIRTAHKLGLSALVEVHGEEEVAMALNAGARIIGVNNRDLKTFKVDIAISEKLSGIIPKNKVFVSESGISNLADMERLRAIGVDAVLIGETLMRSDNKKDALMKLKRM